MGLRRGSDYVAGLRDGRRLYAGGERVEDVTSHPRFRGVVAELAAHYDRHFDPELQDELTFCVPETGERASTSFLIARDWPGIEQRVRGERLRAERTYGLMGRLPDFMNAFVSDMAAAPAPLGRRDPAFAENARRYHAWCRDHDACLTHTLVDPQIDRAQSASAQEALRLVRETDAGIIVTGARMLSTLAPVSDELFVGPFLPRRPGEETLALCFAVPVASPGLTFVARAPYAGTESRFDRPLSSRFDEGDAMAIFDNVLVPWERVFIAGDIEAYNTLIPNFPGYVALQAVIRGAAKLRFMTGIACKVARANGRAAMPRYQEMIGELMGDIEMAEGLVLAAAQETAARAAALSGGDEAPGAIGPTGRQGRFIAAAAMRQFFPAVNTKVCDVIRRTGSSGLVMTVTEGDLDHPDLADILPTYLRGKDVSARERAAVMKLAWDAVATEFGSRQELYEIFYGGDPVILRMAQFHSPARAECEALVDRLLAENAETEQTREAARAAS